MKSVEENIDLMRGLETRMRKGLWKACINLNADRPGTNPYGKILDEVKFPVNRAQDKIKLAIISGTYEFWGYYRWNPKTKKSEWTGP